MKILQEAVQEALHRLPEQVVSDLITKKLAEQGVKLSRRQHKLLIEHVLRGDTEKFSVKGWQWWRQRYVKLDLTQDIEKLEPKLNEFLERLPDLIHETIEDLSKKFRTILNKRWRAESRRRTREQRAFRKRLKNRWKEPLECLRMLLTISQEIGASINQELRENPDPKRKHLVEVLTRCHARACQIMGEIICLLEDGFADGAMARWRTLHEVAVVALFISANGEDLAERYIEHQVVESKRAADDYEKCYKRLGYEAIPEHERKALQTAYDQALKTFGKNFKSQYGWAADYLQKKQPTFRDIEEAAKIDHLRAHYRMASHPVHGNPKGIFFKLGLLDETQVLLAGASDAGLADPGHSAAISLLQVSATLCMLNPTVDNIISLRILSEITGELGQAFITTHRAMLEPEADHDTNLQEPLK